MSKHGNGVEKPDIGQTALDLERDTNQEAPEASQQSAESDRAPAVSELGNSQDGCWKVLADGERVEITDKEWRKELTRLLASPSPQGS